MTKRNVTFAELEAHLSKVPYTARVSGMGDGINYYDMEGKLIARLNHIGQYNHEHEGGPDDFCNILDGKLTRNPGGGRKPNYPGEEVASYQRRIPKKWFAELDRVLRIMRAVDRAVKSQAKE
jgi:hypothetical protein